MPVVERGMDLIGVVLVGGRGERARPITVKAPGYLRSKAAMSLCGKRLIVWLLESMSRQGIREFFVIAHGKENRYQTKTLVQHGEQFGIKVRYSRARFDAMNTGSADALLRMLDHWEIDQPALVMPSDSLYDFSLDSLLAVHRSRGSLVTIASMPITPHQIAGKYGLMVTDGDGRIRRFVEKPRISEIRRIIGPIPSEDFRRMMLPTNAGMYLLDSAGVRKHAQDDEVDAMREQSLDFGHDFLPWLVSRDLPVYEYPVRRTGDTGTVVGYLDTMVGLLRGEFPTLHPLMGEPFDAGRRIWIPPETLEYRDDVSGKTLLQKLDEGLVEIADNVRLGKYVEVAPGVRIVDSNVDDGVDIGEDVEIRRSAIRDGAIVSPGAVLRDSYIGSMVEVRSSPEAPTILEEYVAVGDEVVIQPGVRIVGNVSIYPRLKIPGGAAIPPEAEIRDADDVLLHL
jgi:NDP-sugar pyrophosphorylase family protein